jgi:hypothetical protein
MMQVLFPIRDNSRTVMVMVDHWAEKVYLTNSDPAHHPVGMHYSRHVMR